MAKYFGTIGFAETVETEPGIWEEVITTHEYFGDVNRNARSYQNSGTVNGEINISNEISIVADPYANENFHHICYVEFMGAKWQVKNVDVQPPRLVLSLGGVYNA